MPLIASRLTLPEGLFPDGVSCIISDACPSDFSLLEAEEAATGAMVDRRRREFTHGRCCARLALANLGFDDCPVPVGDDRAPQWPDRVVGSISHCGDTAAAAAAHIEDVISLGIDLERNEELDAALMPMICRSEELARMNGDGLGRLLGTLIFSAKESLFKCIWPEVRRFVDFQEVEIRLNMDDNTYTARPHAEDLPAGLFGQVQGKIGQTGGLWVTAAFRC